MAFDYFDDLQDFYLPALDGAGGAQARAAILKTLAEFGLELGARPMSDAELAALPGHVLFGWRYDPTMSLSFYAIPAESLSPALAGALRTAANKGYAYDEMCVGDARGQAFLRIDAAMGVEGADELAEELGVAIDEAEKDCLAAYRVAHLEHEMEHEVTPGALDRRFVAASTVRRST